VPARSLLAGVDVGTTSVRTVLFDEQGRPVSRAARRQRTFTRRLGWVEQDPEELFQLVRATLADSSRARAAAGGAVHAIGVTNQRESVVAIDVHTGRPLAPAILWQDTRTAELARSLSREGWGERLWDEGGLPLTTYPSAPKMRWLLERSPPVARAAARGTLRFGTLDTWVLYRMMGGAPAHAPWITDASNASRTLLFGIRRSDWDPRLLEHFAIDEEMLAEVRPSFGSVLGRSAPGVGVPPGVPLAADLGDQQSSLLGVGGGARGSAKLTLGTGAFFLAEGAGSGKARSHGLIRTVLWGPAQGSLELGLEGGVGTVGAFFEKLGRGGLGWFRDVQDLERSAASTSVPSSVTFVPALGGLFAPHWDPGARGGLFGLELGTSRAEVARAAFEGVAHRIADILERYRAATGRAPSPLWVDGGLARSRLLLEQIADLADLTLWPHPESEATARGAALAAGLGTGVFSRRKDLPRTPFSSVRPIRPSKRRANVRERRATWRRELARVRSASAPEVRGP
jgi:glycerol kinase